MVKYLIVQVNISRDFIAKKADPEGSAQVHISSSSALHRLYNAINVTRCDSAARAIGCLFADRNSQPQKRSANREGLPDGAVTARCLGLLTADRGEAPDFDGFVPPLELGMLPRVAPPFRGAASGDQMRGVCKVLRSLRTWVNSAPRSSALR
jgi:hypothetical protein